MSFVKILAPLTGGTRDEAVLKSAIAAARPFGAHVAALFVRPDPALAMPFYGEGVSTVMVQEVMDAAKEAADIASRRSRTTLETVTKDAGIAMTETLQKHEAPTASFQEAQGNFADSVARAARLCDLVVFAAPKDDERAGITEAIDATLLEARRPVLLCARAVADGFHEKIAVGWNASVECAQAVTAAMPYLKRARDIEILLVDREGSACPPVEALKDYLALQSVSAHERVIQAGERPVGDVLLESAAGDGMGLLVLGGYGHSRLREMFLGGVTRRAITHAEIPLFIVH